MKKTYYTYNPDTDNFERVFPSVKRLAFSFLKYAAAGIITATIFFVASYYFMESPDEEFLRKENSELKAQYRLLDKRVDEALDVLADIARRDDNFYRVAMQAEPVNPELRQATFPDRFSGSNLSKLPNAKLTAEMSRRIGLLERQIYVQSKSFDELKSYAADMNSRLRKIPSSIPLRNPSSYNIASGYGYRRDKASGIMRLHKGIDFAVAQDTPVYASGDGKIAQTKRSAVEGIFIEIVHNKDYTSLYCNLGSWAVKEGDFVKKGDLIGYTGSSGRSSAPHLHYEVIYKGMPQNPTDYFYSDLTPAQYEAMLKMTANAGNPLD